MNRGEWIRGWHSRVTRLQSWSVVPEPIPALIAPLVIRHHMQPVIRLSEDHGVQLECSRGSCYRPVKWEKAHRRSGGSLHTFPPGSRGACDLVTTDGPSIIHYIDLLVEYGPWRRICYYPGHAFVHVDYGDHGGELAERRQLFSATGPGQAWRLQSYLAEIR